jgi:aminoglycoside phosphotransferase family enzyme
MIRKQIDKLASNCEFPHKEELIQIIETFISWVIICGGFTYKIKRPVHNSFLNFSTIERRKNCCLQEYYLNRQLAGDMYIDVLPVTEDYGLKIGGTGNVVDYALRMKTMDNSKLMSRLLPYDKVTSPQIDDLAAVIADFHSRTRVIYIHAKYDLTDQFNDIRGQIDFLANFLSAKIIESIQRAIDMFEMLSVKLTRRIIRRVNLGFFRDCHGDLHSANIFFMNKPIPFDRLEFNHDLREIDVLNEIAFMCMDLEYYDQPDLSKQFFETYNTLFPAVLTKEDEYLFLLYKAYRANVCAKVNSLKAQDTSFPQQRMDYLKKVTRYLRIMNIYLDAIKAGVLNSVRAERNQLVIL